MLRVSQTSESILFLINSLKNIIRDVCCLETSMDKGYVLKDSFPTWIQVGGVSKLKKPQTSG